jgi:hypothetical protein
MRAAAILVLLASFAAAQDARSIIERAVTADDHSDRLSRDYTYKIHDEVRELDSKGAVKTTHTSLEEVLYIGGKQYFRPLEKDGKPIPVAQAAKEQAKLDRAAAEASRLSPAEREKRLAAAERERAKNREEDKDIPDAFDFKVLGDATISGRSTWRIAATPRPAYRGKSRNIFSSIEATVWIDKQDYNLAKFEAETLKPFSIGWFLARVAGGTHISYEMMRVNDELWVPKAVALKASARLGLIKRINVEQSVTFSDYRKFQTDSRVVASDADLP